MMHICGRWVRASWRTIAVFTVAGVVLTFATAWVGAILDEPALLDPLFLAELRQEQFFEMEQIAARNGAVDTEVWISGAWTCRTFDIVQIRRGDSEYGWHYEIRSGWPWRTFRGSNEVLQKLPQTGNAAGNARRVVLLRDELELMAEWSVQPIVLGRTSRMLPLMPIWSGLALNTLAWMLALALPVALWKGVQRGARWWHGACPVCGYDLRSNRREGCSECGWRREKVQSQARNPRCQRYGAN